MDFPKKKIAEKENWNPQTLLLEERKESGCIRKQIVSQSFNIGNVEPTIILPCRGPKGSKMYLYSKLTMYVLPCTVQHSQRWKKPKWPLSDEWTTKYGMSIQ